MPTSLTTAPAGRLAPPREAAVPPTPSPKAPMAAQRWPLPRLAALLVALPVFLQAPWVRLAPFSAALFTAPLLAIALVLASRREQRWRHLGEVLVGFSGSWLGGCLFWGWCRLHPIWHLPIEAFALPLALGGLRSRWRLAAAFYLASLLGTACTDGVMALIGAMDNWVAVLQAPLDQASAQLHQAAIGVLQPLPLALTTLAAGVLSALCRRLWHHPDPAWRLGASAMATTLAVDGLFLLAALWAPHWSGLI